MVTLTEYIAALSRIRRIRLPQTAAGWMLIILAAALLGIAGSNSLLEKITQDESMKKILKTVLCVLGFVFAVLAAVVD